MVQQNNRQVTIDELYAMIGKLYVSWQLANRDQAYMQQVIAELNKTIQEKVGDG